MSLPQRRHTGRSSWSVACRNRCRKGDYWAEYTSLSAAWPHVSQLCASDSGCVRTQMSYTGDLHWHSLLLLDAAQFDRLPTFCIDSYPCGALLILQIFQAEEGCPIRPDARKSVALSLIPEESGSDRVACSEHTSGCRRAKGMASSRDGCVRKSRLT